MELNQYGQRDIHYDCSVVSDMANRIMDHKIETTEKLLVLYFNGNIAIAKRNLHRTTCSYPFKEEWFDGDKLLFTVEKKELGFVFTQTKYFINVIKNAMNNMMGGE
jgi:hypothetical protein